jgi:hypothetical protein
MSVYSASGTSYPFRRTSQPARQRRAAATWARGRLAGRTNRKLSAANQRAMHRLAQNLGPSWRVLETPYEDTSSDEHDHIGFLAVGPGGVFAVSVVDQGRQRVMIAGEVVQIQGRRPPHVAQARRFAKRAKSALSGAVGSAVPVIPILTFVGSGSMSTHGLPTGCLVVNHRELDHLLVSIGEKITPETARKLADIAQHPTTWPER